MRRLVAFLSVLATAAFGMVMGIGPSHAETVNSNTANCPSQNSVMTSTDWQSSSGYLCAQENHNGDTSIGPDETHTWTVNTNVDYYPEYNCYDTSSSDVTVAPAFIFGSGSFTATNWLAASSTSNNTRHWSAGMLWTLGAGSVTGFSNGCEVSDQTWTDPPDILTLTSFSASGLPDNNQAVAGQAYDITVTFSPSDVTGEVGLLDAPTGGEAVSAAGATINNGVAKFTWIPAQAGDRTITIGYAGDSTHSGAITDDIEMDVTNGVSLNITDITSNPAAGTAVASVDVGPTSLTSEVMIIDTDDINPSTGKPTVLGEAPASNGSAAVTFKYVPGVDHTYIASVVNSSNQVIGQSYAYQWASPPAMTLTIPSATMQQNFRYPGTVSYNPMPDMATTTILQDGTSVASTSNEISTSLPLYFTAQSQGSHNYQATYSGTSTMGASQSPAVTGTVGPGWTISITDIDCPYGSTSCNVYVTVTGTNGAVYNGPVSLYSNVIDTTQPPGPTNGMLVQSNKTASNGQVKFGVSNDGGWTYQVNAVLTDSNNGFLWSNTKSVKLGETALKKPDNHKQPEAKKQHGHPSQPWHGKPGTRPAGFRTPTHASTVDKTKRVKGSQSKNRALTTRCPSGSALMHAEAMSDGPKDAIRISVTKTGATFTAPKSDIGHKMRTQLLCREKSAKALRSASYGLGTTHRDTMAVTKTGGTAFGGLGSDELKSRGQKSTLIGGFGADRLFVAGNRSVADAGIGNDVITAKKARIRALLVGGEGRDILRGSRGASVLDAQDGSGHDRIVCRSDRTLVLADPGDTVSGPCRKVVRNR